MSSALLGARNFQGSDNHFAGPIRNVGRKPPDSASVHTGSTERVTPRLSLQHRLAVLSTHQDGQFADRLGGVNALYLGFSGDCVADKHRRGKLPVLAEEDSSGAGKVHGDKRVQKPRREAALGHEPPEFWSSRTSGEPYW